MLSFPEDIFSGEINIVRRGNSRVYRKWMMGTLISLTVYTEQDEACLPSALEQIEKYEKLLSRFLPESEVYQLNHRTASQSTWQLSESTAEIVRAALSYSEMTHGLFDITTAPLSELWGSCGKSSRVPRAEEIAHAQYKLGFQKLSLDTSGKLSFQSPDVQIDLGGIAKGYIADKVRAYLISQGVRHALINLGGNLICLGGRTDGSLFRIGIQKPFAPAGHNRLIIGADTLSVVSSGAYQRNFSVNGSLYHHIIDPFTGYPCETDLTSVTILSPSSLDGDGLSTCCFMLGAEKGMALLHSIKDVLGIFITENDEVLYSDSRAAACVISEIKD